MLRSLSPALLVPLALAACASPPPPVDMAAEQDAVKTVVDEFPEVLESENMDLFSTIMAHDDDMVAFGTDAAERWVGYEQIRRALEAQFAAFDSAVLVVRDQVIHVNPQGTTAWVSELMDWEIRAGDNRMVLQGSRFTGVLEKRDGHWVFVQFHVSMPVEGQAVSY